jgi:hypothetical protein
MGNPKKNKEVQGNPKKSWIDPKRSLNPAGNLVFTDQVT